MRGLGPKLSSLQNEEYSSSYSPLKLLCITVVLNLLLGGCKVKLS